MQGHHHKEIAQKGRGHGRPHSRVKTLEADDVAGHGGKVAAGGQGHPAEQVKADPDAPGVVVVKVGDGPDTLGETQDGDHQTNGKDDVGENIAQSRPEEGRQVEHLLPCGHGNVVRSCH